MASAIQKGLIAAVFLLAIYFTVISLVSGWNFAQDQFQRFWYFVITLAIGFGIQVGLYSYIKGAMQNKNVVQGNVLALSGTASTAAMISCCAHYIVTMLPILGAVGIITVISQYQIQFFWVGLVFNGAGIMYMINRVMTLKKHL
ncbi:MAG: hypothetical protein NUV98_01955 [Candidatus Roizmanbacteria bacterium]|nr:hypothetical protein [Candidatus Roizmanbacteria bacterium]